jgi:putative DNA primase/helicase
LLGTPSGVLELATGEHRDHIQSDLITKLCGAEFDANATAPTWERVIAEAFRGDESLIDYFQRLSGYMLSGHRGEHLLPIAWGGGANSKGTTLGTLQAMLGEYAGSAAPDLLISKPGSNHPTELADLHGKRLVIASETSEAGRLNEQRAKLLTGGDIIKARRMNRDFFEFTPSHLLVLQTNHRPKVQGTDEGIWRRLRLIPFAYTVPKERRDPALPQKLLGELPGILAWSWRGWQRYKAEGFNDPPAVRAATADYREASDAVGSFLSEFCEIDAHATETAKRLYAGYCQWCEEAGEHAKSQRDFGMRLSEREFERVKHGSGGRWRGLRLRFDYRESGDPSDPSDPDSGLEPRENPSTRKDPKSRVTWVTWVTGREQVRV